MSEALMSEIRVVNFRSARRLVLRPGPVCALIGEPGAGKSNVLFALRALLDPGFDLSSADVTFGERALSIEATLADGRTISLADRTGAPPIVHFPAALRGGELVVGDGRLRQRTRCSADPAGARAGARAARGPGARTRGLRERDRRRGVRDRGAGAVPRTAGPPVPLPAHPSPGRARQPGLLHDACARAVQRRRARRGQPRQPRRARRDGDRAAAPDRRRRHVPRACASSTPSAPSSSSRARRSSSRG